MARNIIIFVADGLRPGSINAIDTPTLFSIQQTGVNFADSHSLFPTFTTPNASAIATGHYLGDTGDFSNTVFTGFPVLNANGNVTPFIENDPVLADINANSNLSDPDTSFSKNNFLTEESLLAFARANGYSTAAIGKLGPVAIQDVTQDTRTGGAGTPNITPKTVILDDSTRIDTLANATTPPTSAVTGSQTAIPLSQQIANDLKNAGLIGVNTPGGTPATTIGSLRVQPSGSLTAAGTTDANVFQQKYFADATTKAILPQFVNDIANNTSNGFAAVYWSRDPDGTQHNNGDAFNPADPGNNSLTIGINGPSPKKAVANADANLKQIIDYLKATPDPANPGHTLYENTDIFVTADHGFSTISKQAVGVTFDAAGTPTFINTTSYAATLSYAGVHAGFLPPGFVAIDLAHDLGVAFYDPDRPTIPVTPANINNIQYTLVDTSTPIAGRPNFGNALIGGSGKVVNGVIDPATKVVVAANGGSDLLYVPSNDPALVRQIVALLAQKDYISGIFTDDKFGDVPGALKLSDIGLKGTAELPTPSIVINFKTFSTNPNNPNDPQAQVEVADTTLQQGQGMHGSFGRGDTFNNMAAIGPDFKSGYVDNAPVSNADVVPTLARILGWTLPTVGTLNGRVISEALVNGPDTADFTSTVVSSTSVNGKSTILDVQSVGNVQYFNAAGFAGGTDGLILNAPKLTSGTNTLKLDNGFGSLLFSRNGNTNNEIGVFTVDNAAGDIKFEGKTYKVSDSGYAKAALERAQILFSDLPSDSVLAVTTQSTQRLLTLPPNALLGFYSIADNTSNQVLSDLDANRPNNSAISFSFTSQTSGNPNDPITKLTFGSGSTLSVKAQATIANVTIPTQPNTIQGASSSQTPYIIPVAAGVTTKSILTVGDSINGYKMAGIPDGLGAFDNGNGTFTLLMNQEIGSTLGVTRAHGNKGAFVSSWVINKSDLSVVSGGDLIQNVYNWNTATQTSNTVANNAANGNGIAFNRFCSADLPEVSAYYNAATGLGSQERIFMDGEEGGATGYQLATIATGVHKGDTYILGKFNLSTNGSGLTGVGAWENALANPFAQDKTIVIGNNDGGTGLMSNSVSVYVGTKTNTGSEIDKAGLTNGVLKFINVAGNPVEITNATTRATNITSGTAFTLSGTASTTFSRPEDGAWNPLNPSQYFFVTTDQLDTVKDGIGTQIGRSRLWRLNFNDITNPDAGGTIDMLLDGTEGQTMFDNLTVDKYGHILLLEDTGNAAHNGKVWQYDIATDSLKLLAKHDPARFGDIGLAPTAPFTVDEEASGIIDAQKILGDGWFLVDTQAHYSITGELVEGGQLQAIFNPDTYKAAKADVIAPDAKSLGVLIDTGATNGAVPTNFVVKSSASYDNLVGYYKVADASGTVIDSSGKVFRVGDVGYAEAAIANAIEDLSLFAGERKNGFVREEVSKNVSFAGGALYAPFLITNGGIDSFLSSNSLNDVNNSGTLAYFAFANANPDGLDHIRSIGSNTIGFEDLFGIGDRDFNDIVLQTGPLNKVAVSI